MSAGVPVGRLWLSLRSLVAAAVRAVKHTTKKGKNMSSKTIIKEHIDWIKAEQDAGKEAWVKVVLVSNSKNGPARYGSGRLDRKSGLLGSFLTGDVTVKKDDQGAGSCPVGPATGEKTKVRLHQETGEVKIGTKKITVPKGESGLIHGFIEVQLLNENRSYYVLRFDRKSASVPPDPL